MSRNSNPVRYKLVSFDFDGTLADSSAWFFETYNRLAPEFGFEMLDPHCPIIRTLNTRDVMRHLGVPLWKLPRLVTRLRTLAAQEANRIPLFPGIGELFNELHTRQIKIAIVSSNSEETVRRVLGAGNASLVNYFACGASLFGKAARLRALLRRSRRRPMECIYIGDETRDAEAARQAQVDFGAVEWGYADPAALTKLSPRMVFSDVREIVPKITAG